MSWDTGFIVLDTIQIIIYSYIISLQYTDYLLFSFLIFDTHF